MTGVDSVLLIAFGGPERSEDIRPFLEIVTAGRRIPAERLEEVAHHYELIGGRSPLNDLTRRQADALGRALAQEGIALPVHVGMRNWHPFLHETLAEMKRRRASARARHHPVVAPDRGLVGALRGRRRGGARQGRRRRARGRLRARVGRPSALHRGHGRARGRGARPRPARAPERGGGGLHRAQRAGGDGLGLALCRPARGGRPEHRGALDHSRWSVAYQSRSGSPRDPWLEPDIGAAIRDLARGGAADVVVAPIGFVCDHVEVLYDLDVEARAVAADVGIGFHRAAAANDHPAFIAMLVDLVRQSAGGRPTS